MEKTTVFLNGKIKYAKKLILPKQFYKFKIKIYRNFLNLEKKLF